MRTSRIVLVALGLALSAPSTMLRAQDTTFTVVDRIAAIVGDSVISLSRIEEELNVYRQQGGTVPADVAGRQALMREVLDNLIDEQLVVQAALRDTTILVSEQDVQVAVEGAMREIRGQFASELEFRRQLEESNFGSQEEYRRWLADQQRRELLRNQLLQRVRERGDLTPLAPTEKELRAFYEESRAQLQRRPATVSFRQIVIRVEADSGAIATARALADSLVRELRNGADFAQVARRYSQDVGTKEQGGDLGWRRRGEFVPQFEAAAFRLKPGQISDPVGTVFGFHVIRVERSQPAEVQVRHILIRPTVTDADRARARERGEAVAQALLDGAPFDSLAAAHHDYAGQEQVLIEGFPRTQLPGVYRDALQGSAPGDVVGPIYVEEEGRSKFAVIRVTDARPEGEYQFEDLRDQLRNTLAERNAMERYLRMLRNATHIEIRL